MSLTDEDKQWIRTELGHFGTELGRFRTELERIETKLERVETTLLTEFHKWASPLEARQRTHTAALRALDLEMESVDDRVKKLEERKM